MSVESFPKSIVSCREEYAESTSETGGESRSFLRKMGEDIAG